MQYIYEKQNFESKKNNWPKHALLSLEKTKEALYDNYNNRLGLGRNMALGIATRFIYRAKNGVIF